MEMMMELQDLMKTKAVVPTQRPVPEYAQTEHSGAAGMFAAGVAEPAGGVCGRNGAKAGLRRTQKVFHRSHRPAQSQARKWANG